MIAGLGLGLALALAVAIWGAFERRAASHARRQLRDATEERASAASSARALEVRMAEIERERVSADSRARRIETASSELRRALVESNEERVKLGRIVEDAQLLEAAKRTVEQERDALRGRLEAAERSIRHLRDPGRDGSRAYVARMEELDKKNRELQAHLDEWARRAVAAEAENQRRDARQSPDDITREREGMRARTDALETALRQGARLRARLRALGIPEPAADSELFNAERRSFTDAAVRELYLSAAASGAGIFDRQGTSWLRYGPTGISERLGASVAIVASARADRALGAPPRLASEQFGVYGRHFAWLPGSPVCLAMTGSRECPSLLLRLTALRLVGVDPPESSITPPVDVPTLDAALSDALTGWAAKRRATAAAVVGSARVGATDEAFAAGCVPLVDAVRALHARAARDGFSDGFGVTWRAEDDTTLSARVLDDDRVVFARFVAPPAPRLLDDLAATVRWAVVPHPVAS